MLSHAGHVLYSIHCNVPHSALAALFLEVVRWLSVHHWFLFLLSELAYGNPPPRPALPHVNPHFWVLVNNGSFVCDCDPMMWLTVPLFHGWFLRSSLVTFFFHHREDTAAGQARLSWQKWKHPRPWTKTIQCRTNSVSFQRYPDRHLRAVSAPKNMLVNIGRCGHDARKLSTPHICVCRNGSLMINWYLISGLKAYLDEDHEQYCFKFLRSTISLGLPF